MTGLSDQEFSERLDALEQGQELPAGLPPDDAADLALAGRLLALQAEPSPDLLAKVQRTIVTSPPARGSLFSRIPGLKRRNPMVAPRMSLWKRLAWAVAALLLVFALTMAAFPSARAAVLEAISKIGGITFVQTDTYPASPAERRGGWMNLYSTTPGGPPVTPLPEESLPLSEAQATLPFTFTVPTWVPQGFVLQDPLRLWPPSAGFTFTILMLTWENAGRQAQLNLSVLYAPQADYEQIMLVGADSVQQVQVHGRPAALVRGAWGAESKQYQATGMLDLRWKQGRVVYSLVGHEGDVSMDDLVRMAESMP